MQIEQEKMTQFLSVTDEKLHCENLKLQRKNIRLSLNPTG